MTRLNLLLSAAVFGVAAAAIAAPNNQEAKDPKAATEPKTDSKAIDSKATAPGNAAPNKVVEDEDEDDADTKGGQ